MSAATGTKTKKVAQPAVRPPSDIVDNTKARRAWLAAELVKLQAQPDLEAKIVGTGSYQQISVYKLVQVAGRMQITGTCQFCGRTQVVKDGVMVLHGYQRPGDGYTIGRCPGVRMAPLNLEKTGTEGFLVDFTKQVAAATDRLPALRAAVIAAEAARDASGENVYRFTNAKPRKPLKFYTTPAKDAAYEVELKAFLAQYPACVAAQQAFMAERDLIGKLDTLKAYVVHFQELLAGPIHGSPLTENVVA